MFQLLKNTWLDDDDDDDDDDDNDITNKFWWIHTMYCFWN